MWELSVLSSQCCCDPKSALIIRLGASLSVQWLRLHASSSRGVGSSPDWGTKIPHFTQPKKLFKKDLLKKMLYLVSQIPLIRIYKVCESKLNLPNLVNTKHDISLDCSKKTFIGKSAALYLVLGNYISSMFYYISSTQDSQPV